MHRTTFLARFALVSLLVVAQPGCRRNGGDVPPATIRAEAVSETPSFEPAPRRSIARPPIAETESEPLVSDTAPRRAVSRPRMAEEEPEALPVRRIGRLPRVESLQIWEVDQEGPISTYFKGCTAGVESIEHFSNERMRWTFTITNRSEGAYNLFLDLKASYVADMDGETYEPIGREFPDNFNSYYNRTLRAGQKMRFWIDFKAPKKPTEKFKVGLLHENQFGAAYPDSFRPFTIELPEPIGPVGTKRREETRPQREEPREGVGRAMPSRPLPEREGSIVKRQEPASEGEAAPTPKSEGPIVALKSDGRGETTYREEARKSPSRAGNDQARIVFEKCYGNYAFIRARVFSQRYSSLSYTLEGKLIEDNEAPSGWAFDLKGPGLVMYRFTIKGEALVGRDNDKNEYVFHPVK